MAEQPVILRSGFLRLDVINPRTKMFLVLGFVTQLACLSNGKWPSGHRPFVDTRPTPQTALPQPVSDLLRPCPLPRGFRPSRSRNPGPEIDLTPPYRRKVLGCRQANQVPLWLPAFKRNEELAVVMRLFFPALFQCPLHRVETSGFRCSDVFATGLAGAMSRQGKSMLRGLRPAEGSELKAIRGLAPRRV
jgi:hypothetical protein